MRNATGNSAYYHLLLLGIAFLLTQSSLFGGVTLRKPTVTGKDYYIVFPHAAYGDQNVEALVNSPVKQKIHIQAAGTAGGGGYKNIPVNQYQDIETGIFHIERNSEVLDPKGAARITTVSPVTVIGQFGSTGISGTYNALPISAWGTEYYVLDEPEGTNSGYQGYYPGVYSVPQVTIIASQPNTTVKITLPSSTRTALNKTGTFSVTFNNAGDVYYFTDGADPNAIDRVESTCLSPAGDFTGTHIVSDDPKKPIGVIVSQSHTSEPCGDNECGDFGMEWLPPVCNWDTAYVIAPSIAHGGANPGQGEVLRVTFAYNNTVLYKTDANGTIAQGTYDAGTPLFFNDQIKTPYVLSASQPFLVCMITTKPQSCLVGSRGGGANFTFSMAILPGISQWADYVPFGAADLSSFVQANLYFRQSDEKNLFFNGTPLITPSSIVTKIPGTPYAYMVDTLGSNTYYELRGDSGATIGGVMFGYGQSQVSANNGDRSSHTLNPEMVKSYAHPIVINALPACSPDTTAPHAALHYSCGSWFPDTAWDDELFPQASGIYDIYLAENRAPDSSFNVRWSPPPSFTLGTNLGVQFGIQVINLADTAVAALHVRDGAGNEWDTILTYAPIHLIAQPTAIDVGAIPQRDSVRRSIILTDSGKSSAIFTTMRLAIGQYWKILNPPMFPLTIAPGKSDTIYVQFTAPNSAIYECYPDTLIVNLCRQFPIVTMIGCTKKPAIYTSDYDFGCWFIDTIGTGGDTVYSPATKDGIYLASIGVDTLHVTDARIAGLIPTDPSQDFAIMSYFDKMKNTSVNLPDTMPPGDTLFVIVRAHPHLEGDNYADILYTDDANHYLRDTSLLHICGILPAMVMHDLDYRTHLYATTKDSFVVVKNISNTPFTVERLSPFGPDSAYFVAYPYGQGYIDPTTGVYIQYPDTFYVVYPHFSAADSARYPYRFYARKLGLNVDSVQVANTSNVTPTFALLANVVQPHVWAWSGCLADTLRTGDTATAVVQMGNAGTDILTVDTVSIGGPNPANWSVSGIENTTTVQSVSVPFTLQPGDRANVRLLYTATQNGRPDETVSFTGYDALGRHANDSLVSLYGWGIFPYDTTVRIVDCALSGVNEHVSIPSEIMLSQNYPNPFSTVTTFTFTSRISAQYYIDIYNSLGERIAVLPTMEMQPGRYTAAWDALGWASGVYYYRVSAGVNSNSTGRSKSFLLLR